jgi:hypothetical protein
MTLQTPPEVLPVANNLADFLRTLPIIKGVRFEEVDDHTFGRMTIVKAETKYVAKALEPKKRKFPINGPGGKQPSYERGPVCLEYQISGQDLANRITINNPVQSIGLLVRLGTSEFPIPLENIDLPKSDLSTILEAHKKVDSYLAKQYEPDVDPLFGAKMGYIYRPPRAIGPAA